MKNYFIFLYFLIFNLTIAQEKVSSIPLITEKKTVLFEIVDTKAKELLLYQRDPVATKVLKTNEKLQVIDTAYFETPNPLIFDKYLGHSKKNENYSVYWSNDKRDSIFYQQIDFKLDELKSKIIRVDFQKEKLLGSITVGTYFYLITIPKNGNSLTFHQFNEGEYQKKTIDFAAENFYHSNNKNSNSIWDVFNDGFLGFQTITSDVLVSLPFTQILKKLYILNDKEIIFTFDGNAFFTQILKINLADYSYSLQNCEKSTKVPKDEFEKLSKTNSFICNDKLFQIISNSEFATIDIKNFKFETLKSYRIDKDKEIDFINSGVFQENYEMGHKRVLDKSSQFIYRLNNLHLGLTCQFSNGRYNVIFGAFSDVENATMYGGMFGLAGALVDIYLSPSYSMQSINSYAGRQVVYTSSLLDDNLNPVKGKMTQSAFDTMRAFASIKNYLIYPMSFKFDQTTYFGGYDKKTKLLSFYKFND